MTKPDHDHSLNEDIKNEDIKTLHNMGYSQELARGMRAFSNFAIAFSVICILSGGINSLGQGIAGAGGASIGIGWPIGCGISMLFALGMAQIASAYPTAGGLYHWSSILGGAGAGLPLGSICWAWSRFWARSMWVPLAFLWGHSARAWA